VSSQTHDARLSSLSRSVARCMLGDQGRLRRRLRGVRNAMKSGKQIDHALERIEADVAKSERLRQRRARLAPTPRYPADLPIVQRKDEIARAIREHPVVVVCGDTGSGKSTQLPKICLELGRGVGGMIGHTQPRRIAARSVAARVAEELGAPLARRVGYKVRFGDKTSDETLIKVMTDGVLLAETQGDRLLRQYDTIIIDEAHERSLNVDFLLGVLRRILARRDDLKVIITSATIDPQRFSRHFPTGEATREGEPIGAPVIEVSGRAYPVEVLHRPLETEDPEEADRTAQEAILHAIDETAALDPPGDPGDTLVFLPGEREIRETAEALRKHRVGRPGEKTETLPLFARLSAADQKRVFERRRGVRRIVLATNVAETSLTVPGIRYVVDTGVAKISRYNPRTKVQRLPTEPISRSSADQRKGRCGRVGPGVCVRLYSEADYDSRPRFTDPEIRRTSLASVILQMTALGLGKPEEFPFLEPPDPRAIRDGYETLRELGAVDEHRRLTDIGRDLARLPIDPRIGRMVLASIEEGALREALIIAAALSAQDPRERPMDKRSEADAAHERFADESSDFLAFLNMWEWLQRQRAKKSENQVRKSCKRLFLSYMRMREWTDVHRQLRELVLEMGSRENTEPASYARVHRSLLAGLLTSVGRKDSDHEYAAPRGARFHIFPGSGLFQKKPQWVMAGELVRTTRLYARSVARIEPTWVERVGAHLTSREHFDPYWDERRAQVRAYERVLLFGLEVIPKRSVHFAPIDPVTSREMFIHHALVRGEFASRAPFMKHNARLIKRIERLEAKARRRDLLAGEEARFDFFDRLLPQWVTSGEKFEVWRRQAEKENPEILFLTEADLLIGDASEVTEDRFPEQLRTDGLALPLRYRLEPGEREDGVTVRVPIEALPRLDRDRLEWLTPGLLEEKVTAMIRSLPKEHRRLFAPAGDAARRVVRRLEFGRGRLDEQVADALGRICGAGVDPSLLRAEALPDHLRMNVRVIDDHGREIASGRDVERLKERLRAELERRLADAEDARFHHDDLRSWSFGELPERVRVRRGGIEVEAFPTLLDKGDRAAMRLLSDPQEAAERTRSGLRRLAAIELGRAIGAQIEHELDVSALRVGYSMIGPADELQRGLIDLIAERACFPEGETPRDHDAFERALTIGWNRLSPATRQVGAVVRRILDEHQKVRLLLERTWGESARDSIVDVESQLRALVRPGFLSETPFEWLYQFPRYLVAAQRRLERLSSGGRERDERLMAEIAPQWRAYLERSQVAGQRRDPALASLRWMLEEFRVALFAQDLGTAAPVSARRLEDLWRRVRIEA